ILWVTETHHGLAAGWDIRQRLTGFRAPGAVVARFEACGSSLVAHGFYLVWRAIAIVGCPFLQHALYDFAVAVHALHLVERAFVGCQAQPFHAIKYGLNGFGRGAFQVSVFDAQDEGSAVMPGKCPREQGSAGASQVQEAGWGWSKASTDDVLIGGHGKENGRLHRVTPVRLASS